MNEALYIERLEYELVRSTEKRKKLEEENKELSWKLSLLNSDKGELLLNTIKKKEVEIEKLEKTVSSLVSFQRTQPKDRWYLAYLQGAVADLEHQLEQQQIVIEQYQKHYAKFGSFYHDLEERMRVE